jgi:subtilase family serine protease
MRLGLFRGSSPQGMLHTNGFGADCRNFCVPQLIFALLAATLVCGAAGAQAIGRSAESAEFRAIPNHVPSWAKPENFAAAVPDGQKMESVTLVLARHPDQEQAFEALLAAQQDPASPEYHRWLTSTEIGERFGASTEELDKLTGWLESQGLHVDWVAPGRNFIGFSGSAGDMSSAFRTEINYYDIGESRKMSVAAPPMVPTALAPLVKAVRGLSTIDERPLHVGKTVRSGSPEVTAGTGEYYVAPADFNKIYDVPATYTGQGVAIGIVGLSRVDTADLSNFKQLTATSFANPTVIVPTAFGGSDPGPAATAPPAPDAQGEATLDVMRASSIAQAAKVLLVVNKPEANGSGNIFPDAQYLVQTKPVPVQIINISFGSCESESGEVDVDSWDSLFQQAAGEGISVFVSSGDSGASGCDAHGSAPPSDPEPNSPNSLCSSSYATCVGGTEFNDASDYTKYWSSSNGTGFLSALSYIPEGAWNEPLDGNDEPEVAATGGGVSLFIATPIWQTGRGVPSARAGRYTPDIAFSASIHDGYFSCFAAAGASCVPNSQNEFEFEIFGGTSAAAPDMAGVTALLDQKMGKGVGNLNPELYSLAASTPSVFHDVTVATSGVSGCTVNTPSMCNNSIPGPDGLTGGQAGFEAGTGFDETTGLGSLDVGKFLSSYTSGKLATAVTGKATAVTAAGATLAGTVNANGQSAKYWFAYGTSSTLAGAAQTPAVAVSGSSVVTVTAKLTKLMPGTKYYFQLQASDSGGTATGAIGSFATLKGTQTITFKQPASPVKYGVAPIALSATSSSGLAVSFKVLSGPAKRSGSTIAIIGAGTVVVEATQAGSTNYLAAANVTRSIIITKNQVTVTAKSGTMVQGGAVPKFGFSMTGWVNGDNRYTATKGAPAISTTATSNSVAGSYAIKISAGTLTATSYTFKFVNGTMTVTK